MRADDLQASLREIYIESLRLNPDKAPLDASGLIERLNITSILALEIMVGIEIRFDIELDTAQFDVRALDSITALADYLHPHLPRLETP